MRIAGGEQRFVFVGDVQGRRWGLSGIVQQDELLNGIDAVADRFQDRQKFRVDQDHVIFGVIDGVENLLGGQADIDGMQHRTQHRHREKAFQIAVAVPIHHRDGIAGLDAQPSQPAGQPTHPLAQIAVGLPLEITVDDLLIGELANGGAEQILDQERAIVGRGRAINERCGHGDFL